MNIIITSIDINHLYITQENKILFKIKRIPNLQITNFDKNIINLLNINNIYFCGLLLNN